MGPENIKILKLYLSSARDFLFDDGFYHSL